MTYTQQQEYVIRNGKQYKPLQFTPYQQDRWKDFLKLHHDKFDIIYQYQNRLATELGYASISSDSNKYEEIKIERLELAYIFYKDYIKMINAQHIVEEIKESERLVWSYITRKPMKYKLPNHNKVFEDWFDCWCSFFDLPIETQNLLLTEYEIANL